MPEERPGFRDAVVKSQRDLVSQGMDPKAARERAKELALRKERADDNRR